MKVILKPHEIWTKFNLPIGTEIEIEGTVIDDSPKEGKWQPEDGDKYWYIWGTGDIDTCNWYGEEHDITRKDFFGIYKTKEEAEVARDKIRTFVQGGMK